MKSLYPLVRLGDLTLTITTWNPVASNSYDLFSYIDISSVSRETKKIENIAKIFPQEAPSRARQIVKEKDVLVSTVRPNLNAVAYISQEFDCATASTGFTVLRCKETKIDSKYLYYWVRSSPFIDDMTRKSTGASYPAISDKIVKESKIPLPPIAEQKRIAAIFDKADAIRRKRQEAIKLTEELGRSLFLDMFGDPVTNPKGWELASLSKFGEIVTGNTPPRADLENYGDDIEWIKSDNITTPYHFLTQASESLSKQGKEKGRIVPEGSILVCCIAGSKSSIGKAAIAHREVAFNQQINAIIPNENTDTYFLYSHFWVSQNLVQEKSTDSMKGLVSKSKFSSIKFLRPPIKKQLEFREKFLRFIKINKRMEKHLMESENIFNSLLQRAFKGEI